MNTRKASPNTPPLTVAFLLGNLTVGGSETKVVRLANRLAREGHSIHIVALGEPYTLRTMIEPDVQVECLDRKSRFSPSVLRRFRAYVEEHAIPVTVCINTYPLVYGWPVRMMLGRGRNVCIAAVNTSDHTTTRDRLFMILYAAILRRCDGLIFGSHGQAMSWIRRYRLSNPRTTVIHNGVDTGQFHADQNLREQTRKSLAIDDTSFVVGCVAQFRLEKNHANLLEAVAQLRARSKQKVVVLLVGDGPEGATIRTLVARKGLEEHVRFVGRVEDVRPYLNAMDVFVMPSTSVEVFSNAVLEAMSVGVPVISSDTGGASEMIRDGVDGFVYPRHDIECLSDRLYTVMTDAAKRGALRQNATQRVQREFTLEKMDSAYVDFISASCRTRVRPTQGVSNKT